MTAVSSMRLLVVAGLRRTIPFFPAAQRRMAPHPPGPGLPEQALSVYNSTSFMRAPPVCDEDGLCIGSESFILQNFLAAGSGETPKTNLLYHSPVSWQVTGRTAYREHFLSTKENRIKTAKFRARKIKRERQVNTKAENKRRISARKGLVRI